MIGQKTIIWHSIHLGYRGFCVFYAKPSNTNFVNWCVHLSFVKCAKIIGIWLHDYLKWDKQIKEMLKKANSRLFMLCNLKRFSFKSSELGIIYNGFFRSLLEHGDVVCWSLLTYEQATILEKVLKRACKIILGKNYSFYTDGKNHSSKWTMPNSQRTSTVIPPARRSVYGRDLRNSNSITLLPCRTERFRKSPIPYFIDLLNNKY